MSLMPHNKGGGTPFRSLSANATGTVVFAGPCCLYELQITNNAAATRFLKLYDVVAATTGIPIETDVPVRTIELNANQSVSITIPCGLQFDRGLSFRGTTGVADNNTGAVTANDIVLSGTYAGSL